MQIKWKLHVDLILLWSKFTINEVKKEVQHEIRYIQKEELTHHAHLESKYRVIKGAIVLTAQNFDPAKNWMDKMQLSEIFTAKRCRSKN